MGDFLAVVAVILAVIFCIWAYRRSASIEQQRDLQLTSEFSPFMLDSKEQRYLDWVEIDLQDKAPEVEIGKEPIKNFITERSVDQVSPDDTLEVVVKKLYDNNFRILAVVNATMIGTIGSKDIKKAWDQAVAKKSMEMLLTMKASDIVERNYTAVESNQSLDDVVRKMNEDNRMSIVVLDEQHQPFGIVSRTQLAAKLRRRLLTLPADFNKTNGIYVSSFNT